MKLRKKDYVRQSGYVSYNIEVRIFYFWFTYKHFMTTYDREVCFDELIFYCG